MKYYIHRHNTLTLVWEFSGSIIYLYITAFAEFITVTRLKGHLSSIVLVRLCFSCNRLACCLLTLVPCQCSCHVGCIYCSCSRKLLIFHRLVNSNLNTHNNFGTCCYYLIFITDCRCSIMSISFISSCKYYIDSSG